jgi:hypothetical protein
MKKSTLKIAMIAIAVIFPVGIYLFNTLFF